LKARGDLAGLCEAARASDVFLDGSGQPVDLSAGVRIEAIEALSDFYGPEVAEAIAQALGDDAEEVRDAAARALRKVHSQTIVPFLLEVLAKWPEEAYAGVREEARDALLRLETPALPERFATVIVESRDAPVERGQDALLAFLAADERGAEATEAMADAMSARLGDSDAEVSKRAETLIGWVAAQATPVLLRREDSPDTRLPTARLLGYTGDTAAHDPLVALLQDSDSEVRTAAARSLGQLKDTRAVEALLSATRDSDVKVRDAAVRALDSLGSAGIVVGLVALAGRGRDSLPGEAPELFSRLLGSGDDPA
jgi:HEAT repeat protein